MANVAGTVFKSTCSTNLHGKNIEHYIKTKKLHHVEHAVHVEIIDSRREINNYSTIRRLVATITTRSTT